MNTAATQVPRTLIADEQPDVLAALRLLLKDAGYQTEAVDSPKAVLDAISHQKFDLDALCRGCGRQRISGGIATKRHKRHKCT